MVERKEKNMIYFECGIDGDFAIDVKKLKYSNLMRKI